jgi:hypothetical protein
MKIGWLGGIVVAFAMSSLTHAAYATTWEVNCSASPPTLTNSGGPTENFGTDPGGLTGSGTAAGAPDALGALLGTPSQSPESVIATDFGVTLAPGDLVEITGMCNQPVEIKTSGITLSGPSGNISVASGLPGALTNGIDNQALVQGAQRVVINDILIGSSTTAPSLATSGYAFAGTSLLTLFDGADVTIENAEIKFSPSAGIYLDGGSVLRALSSLINDNGTGNANEVDNGGIVATGASAVFIGRETGIDPANVSENNGDGIRLSNGSSLIVTAGNIESNGLKQIFALTSSSVILNGGDGYAANGNFPLVFVNTFGHADPAIAIETGSSLLVENQAAVQSNSASATIAALGSSSMLLEGSFISGTTTTLQVTGGSLLALAGGNIICNGSMDLGIPTPFCAAATGSSDVVIEVDHVSALYDLGAITGFNFTPQADTITGAGVLELQSTADLGAGQISGQPSLNWTTGSNGISVAQNSSLRLQGGVNITGSIALAQGSNGFVNLSTTPGVPNANTVSAGISCPFVNIPSAHLQLGKNSLAPSTPATVVATSLTGVTSPQCLSF